MPKRESDSVGHDQVKESASNFTSEQPKERKLVYPDCGCTDGTEPDEPADRGFICEHNSDAAETKRCGECKEPFVPYDGTETVCPDCVIDKAMARGERERGAARRIPGRPRQKVNAPSEAPNDAKPMRRWCSDPECLSFDCSMCIEINAMARVAARCVAIESAAGFVVRRYEIQDDASPMSAGLRERLEALRSLLYGSPGCDGAREGAEPRDECETCGDRPCEHFREAMDLLSRELVALSAKSPLPNEVHSVTCPYASGGECCDCQVSDTAHTCLISQGVTCVACTDDTTSADTWADSFLRAMQSPVATIDMTPLAKQGMRAWLAHAYREGRRVNRPQEATPDNLCTWCRTPMAGHPMMSCVGEIQPGTLADEVLKLVHAFSDVERKDMVRALAHRVRQLEERVSRDTETAAATSRSACSASVRA